jgi:hypothetical protein
MYNSNTKLCIILLGFTMKVQIAHYGVIGTVNSGYRPFNAILQNWLNMNADTKDVCAGGRVYIDTTGEIHLSSVGWGNTPVKAQANLQLVYYT